MGLQNINQMGMNNQGGNYLGNNSKTPKEAYKRNQGLANHQSLEGRHGGRGLSSDDRLNLSVDIVGRHQSGSPTGGASASTHQMNNLNRSGGQNYKKHGNARDYSLRMSRVADDKLLNNSVNSVHEFNGGTKR